MSPTKFQLVSCIKDHCPLELLLPGKLSKFKDDDNKTVSIPHDIPELVRLVQELADYEKMSDGPQACYWCNRITCKRSFNVLIVFK